MTPERPVFFEGQILAAADLTGAVDYGRAEVARHDRYLHDWGIAEGLEMTTKPDATGKYVDVTLGAGVAIDGTGREIVVPQAVPLDTEAFFTANGASPQVKANYPILLHGIDTAAPAPPLAAGACGAGSQSTRTQEGFDLTYGALGAELHLGEQPVPDVSAGPVRADGLPWEVLVGFVQWDSTGKNFTAAFQTGVRYAGVKADTVAARSGTLELRSRPTVTPGQPVLTIGGDPPVLKFGLYQGGGNVDARLTVTAKGDVTAIRHRPGHPQPGPDQGPVRDRHSRPGHPAARGGHPGAGRQRRGDPAPASDAPHAAIRRRGLVRPGRAVPWTPSRQLTCQVMSVTGATLSGNPQPGVADYLMVATVASGAKLMSKLTVVFLKDTGHVLAALTRADPPAAGEQVSALVGTGLPMGAIDGTSADVIVPVANLDAVTVDDQPEVLLDPQGFQVVEDPQTAAAAYGDERRSAGQHGRPRDLPRLWAPRSR